MSTFKFKQFEVKQEQSAQKIGTDSVLLATWCDVVPDISNVLDVGVGTGVISLILAQRLRHAQIDGVEIDDGAFEEATTNFENSPWSDRLYCYHASFQEFYEEDDMGFFDLIISNPPYFETPQHDTDQVKSSREIARFDDSLPFEELIYGVYQLLSKTGTFACIIPKDRENRFIEIAAHYQLDPVRITYVRGTATSEVKRCLMEFSFRESETERLAVEKQELVLEISRHVYTKEYLELVKDFYLKL